MSDPNGKMREYRPGDEESILALFNRVFDANRTMRRWRWQFIDHVQGKGWITLAEADDEIIGQYCMMRNHLNFRGREVCAGQSCDTMVRHDQRGKGWFARLAEANYTHAAGMGLKAVFGFPNRLSYPVFMRDISWRRITRLKCYYYRIGFRKIWGALPDRVYKLLLGRYLKSKLAGLRSSLKGAAIVTTKTAPEDIEGLLEEVRSREVLSAWKDLKYLKWRYENHPEFRYTFHVLTMRGRPECLVITKHAGGRIAVCDVLHRTKNVPEAAFLLLHATLYHVASCAQVISFCGHDDGFFDSVFARCGYHARHSESFVFCGRVFSDAALEERFFDPNNWTVAYGDIDVS